MKPVFIGGCGRSGTTFLGSLLGAAPGHLTLPEMHFKFDVLSHAARSPEGTVDIAELRSRIGEDWRFKKQWAPAAGSLEPGAGVSSARDFLEQIVRWYGQAVGQSATKVWVDHTPANLRYAARLAAVFPDAAFVHIVRDGRAVAASSMKLDWGPFEIEDAVRQWLRGVGHGLAAETAEGFRAVRVRFEDIVEDPGSTLARVCADIGIPYCDEMAGGGGFVPAAYNRQTHELVGGPPRPERMRAWEGELSPREIEIFENLTCDLLPELGYELLYGLDSRAPSRGELRKIRASGLYRRKLLKPLHRRRLRRAP